MFHTIFFVPLYNALMFLTGTFGGSLGLAVIGLTIIVKLILSPLAHASIKSQIEQKKLQPLIEDLKKKYPDQKEQSVKLMELYKEHKTNPFAGCLLLLLQLPVIIALYNVFMKGVTANAGALYSFVPAPDVINTIFLGISMSSGPVWSKLLLAALAGITQFLQMHWSPAMQDTKPQANTLVKRNGGAPQGDMADMAATMTKSMKYTMPVMIAVFAYAVPGAVALYWIVSNLFMIAQERVVVGKKS